MNTQNNSVQTAQPHSKLDILCRQRLLSPDFGKPLKLNYQILQYLRSFKRG